MGDSRLSSWRLPLAFSGGDARHRLARMAAVCAALLLLLGQPGAAAEWQSVDTTDDGIEIFRREAGDRLVAFRGVGVVEAPPPLVATVLFDTHRRKEWIEGLVDSRIIRWGGEDTFVEYDHIDMPLFFSDRDFVSKITMSFDRSGRMAFHYQPAEDPAAPPAGYVRGEVLEATFILSSLDNGTRTKVDAEFLSDPKGWIPKWLVNFFVEDWPKRTFRRLRREVTKTDIPVDPRFSRLLPVERTGPTDLRR